MLDLHGLIVYAIISYRLEILRISYGLLLL
jgi:hypothetical protein